MLEATIVPTEPPPLPKSHLHGFNENWKFLRQNLDKNKGQRNAKYLT